MNEKIMQLSNEDLGRRFIFVSAHKNRPGEYVAQTGRLVSITKTGTPGLVRLRYATGKPERYMETEFPSETGCVFAETDVGGAVEIVTALMKSDLEPAQPDEQIGPDPVEDVKRDDGADDNASV